MEEAKGRYPVGHKFDLAHACKACPISISSVYMTTRPEALNTARKLPELPLPWQPHKRIARLSTLSLDNWKMSKKSLDEIRAYLRTRYIITGAGLLATDEVLRTEPSVFQTQQDPTILQRRFEHGILGLKPNDSSDGLRWWTSAAGGSGGTYPIRPIAELVGASPDRLREDLSSGIGTRAMAFLHFDNFLLPVMKNPLDAATVHADHIVELNPVGEKVLEIALTVAERNKTS